MSYTYNMKILRWLTFTVLFTVSLSFSIEIFGPTFEDSTSESPISYETPFEDSTSESLFDYNLIEKELTTESTSDYDHIFVDPTPDNAFESSDIKYLRYPPDDRNCPVHEHWEFCTGFCQRNCSNWSKALICPDICVQGCLCDWGFTRGPEGNCIPVSECPPTEEPIKINVQYKCRRNEHFSACGGHEECQKDCLNYDDDIACPDSCEPGCVCNEGFVRGRTGKCIPIERCPKPFWRSTFQSKQSLPKLCKSNEHFSACEGLPMCQRSCSNYNESIICPLICVPGCVCDKDYVIGPTGECIPIEQCHVDMKSSLTQEQQAQLYNNWNSVSKDNKMSPEVASTDPKGSLPKLCKSNEHFSACEGLPMCQRSCSNYNESIICPLICVPGCVCDKGYVIGPTGECIPIEQCHLNMKPSLAQEQQTHSYNNLNSVSKDNEMSTEVASTNAKVSRSLFCRSNEHFSPCLGYRPCQKTCLDYDKPVECLGLCIPGCICDYGFVRGPTGKCIPIDRCPPRRASSLLQESKQSQSSSEWNSAWGNTNEEFSDISSTYSEDFSTATMSPVNIRKIPDCPDEATCNWKCKARGYKYGVCIGYKQANCSCFGKL